MVFLEPENQIVLGVCRACGDYNCGTACIDITNTGDEIFWDLSKLYDNEDLKIGKMQYCFDAEAYKSKIEQHEQLYLRSLNIVSSQ